MYISHVLWCIIFIHITRNHNIEQWSPLLTCFCNVIFHIMLQWLTQTIYQIVNSQTHSMPHHNSRAMERVLWLFQRKFSVATRQIWGIWKLRPAYSTETPNLGQNGWCFVPCDLEIWLMTLENNRASLLCCFKLCATFHSHWWIQTGITVRKRPIWVKFNVFLAVWPWNLTNDLVKQ